MGRRNKKMIQEEMIREGEEILSAVDGFLLGLLLFVVRLIENWTQSNPMLHTASLVVEVLIIIGTIVGVLSKLKYGGWIVVKYLLSFVLTYAMFRILFFGWF